ncbi:MAG: ExbD/TolR family protein, partial [Holosporaceae bacterium]|nr:ExbD/TolR family protein [Holosporaceae bacterium]
KKNNRKNYDRRSSRALMSDINVTPMIDVMLVLLVIFMVTAPFLTIGVKVNLPHADAPNVTSNDTPIVVHVDSSRRVFIGDVEVTRNTIADKLRAITNGNMAGAKIFVRGDRAISYGDIMEIMGQISSSGFQKVILVTEAQKKHRSGDNVSQKW